MTLEYDDIIIVIFISGMCIDVKHDDPVVMMRRSMIAEDVRRQGKWRMAALTKGNIDMLVSEMRMRWAEWERHGSFKPDADELMQKFVEMSVDCVQRKYEGK